MHRDLVGVMFVRGRIFFQVLTFYQLVGIFESYSFFLTKYEFNLINEQNFNVKNTLIKSLYEEWIEM